MIMLPLVALTTKPASYVFSHFEMTSSTGITDKAYAVVLSLLVSQYSLYGYDAAAHLTEETKGADKNGPIAILSSLGIISVFGWAYILALTFSIQVLLPIFLVSDCEGARRVCLTTCNVGPCYSGFQLSLRSKQ